MVTLDKELMIDGPRCALLGFRAADRNLISQLAWGTGRAISFCRRQGLLLADGTSQVARVVEPRPRGSVVYCLSSLMSQIFGAVIGG